MRTFFWRPWVAVGLCSAGLLSPSHAHDTFNIALNLADALDAAWAQSPQSQAHTNRKTELTARSAAAQALFAGPPRLGFVHRTDRIGSRAGLRDYEAELAVPLWNPGVRQPTQGAASADQWLFEGQQRAAKLRLAGQLRELAALVALQHSEFDVADHKLIDAHVLAQDVARRYRAGDVARVDSLQAQTQVYQAELLKAQAQNQLTLLQTQWAALTGEATVSVLDESLGVPGPSSTISATAALTSSNSLPIPHPLAIEARAGVESALARLALAQADQRDPVELGVGLARDRSADGSPPNSSLRLALRIPLGGDQRNAAKLAAARAELDAQQARADAVTRQLQAAIQAAEASLANARSTEAVATQRALVSAEVQTLIAKSYRLGQSDLPTRLRAEHEKYDADLTLYRARTEVRIAISRLNQAYGLLP